MMFAIGFTLGAVFVFVLIKWSVSSATDHGHWTGYEGK